jgi:hypothetical protein
VWVPRYRDLEANGKQAGFSMPESIWDVARRADQFFMEASPIVRLETLLELKLASGMTTSHRPRDLDDVIQLIRANRLPLDFVERLNPYVAAKFRELWQAAQVVEDY